MQTIVNLVSAGLGLASVPASGRQFKREAVAYREVAWPKRRPPLRPPSCENSLVWLPQPGPAMVNFIAVAKAQLRLGH